MAFEQELGVERISTSGVYYRKSGAKVAFERVYLQVSDRYVSIHIELVEYKPHPSQDLC
jgi:hypothetical protein